MSEQIVNDANWNQLNTSQQQELIATYGEPFLLPNVQVDIVGKRNDGHCPGNENVLAAMMFVTEGSKPGDPFAKKVRERMRERHGIELVGPMLHFVVDGFNPRILFVGIVIDRNGRIFKPGTLYAYSSDQADKLRQLFYAEPYNSVNQSIVPINTTTQIELKLEEVRGLQPLPTQVGSTRFQDEDGWTPTDYGPLVVANYMRRMLMNEAMESGEEEKFYTELLKNLPEIFAESSTVVEVSPLNYEVPQERVGHPTDFTKPREQWPSRGNLPNGSYQNIPGNS